MIQSIVPGSGFHLNKLLFDSCQLFFHSVSRLYNYLPGCMSLRMLNPLFYLPPQGSKRCDSFVRLREPISDVYQQSKLGFQLTLGSPNTRVFLDLKSDSTALITANQSNLIGTRSCKRPN